MGLPRFAKILKYGCLAVVGLAAALAAIAALSSPATAAPGGGGGADDEYKWDTDNLVFSSGGSSYNAKSFAVPHYSFGGDAARSVTNFAGVVENHSPCQSGVMDGFFQSGASQPRNDLPVLEKTGTAWEETEGNICDVFVTAQDNAISRAASNGGYWLDSTGNLRKGGLGGWASRSRIFGALGYVSWANKGSNYRRVLVGGLHYAQVAAPSTADEGYIARVDYGGTGGRTVGVDIPSGGLSLPSPPVRGGSIVTGSNPKVFRTSFLGSYGVSRHLPHARSVGGSHAGAWCPSGFHPRGEDSFWKIGGGTGRTLSSLTSETKVRLADMFWCRSDVRYPIWYAPQSVAETTCGTAGAPVCPAGVTIPTSDFRGWGRVNCYRTALRIGSDGNCEYAHPVPRCTDNGTKRNFTEAELDGHTTGEVFAPSDDGTTDCAAAPAATPAAAPSQADFTADACVTASMVIYENAAAGSDAEPGIASGDRTLAAADSRTAWDLDITSPHPLTASPPRDATAGDASGCADGSESRAGHSSSPGGAARKQSPAPSYASSDRTDSAVPPNDDEDDIDYTGVSANLAHRYASKIAENTCAAKRAEAEAELALLELREAAFAQWLDDYKTAADTNTSRMGSYTRTPRQSAAGLAVLRFNDIEANKATYAGLLKTRYEALSSALAAAKTAYDTATDRSSGSNRAAIITSASDNGCVAHYDREITRLKTLFGNAETAALGNGASGIKEERTSVAQTSVVAVSDVSVRTSVNDYSVPDISAVESRRETSMVCADNWNPPFCTRPEQEGEDCGILGCQGSYSTITTIYYTCPGGTYTVSGTVSGSYKSIPRSRGFSATYTAAARTTESTSRSCPGFVVQSGASYSSTARAYVLGTPNTASALPSLAGVAAPAASRSLGRLSLLGSYHPSHADRASLAAVSAAGRNTAAASLSVAVGAVPAGSPQKIADYQSAYKTAYDTAYTQATGHMSGTSWDSFDWQYQTSTLAWSSYQEDPAGTYSGWVAQAGETETDRNGTGCDLVNVSADGTVTVETTRLDYETSSYGKASVYGTRTASQRECKIRRTRTPELLLMYASAVPSGVDTSKTADTRLDADSTKTNAEFYYVDYQPTPASERFKLYDEAEVFTIRVSLADSPPVFCYSSVKPTVYVSHKSEPLTEGKAFILYSRLYQPSTTILRPAVSPPAITSGHCFAQPSMRAPAVAVFDDTAHSDMNLVALEKDPTETIAETFIPPAALVASSTTAYPGDTQQTSVFYGRTYSIAPATAGDTSSWDASDPDNAYDLSSKIKHRITARDKPATPNLPATPADASFKFASATAFGIGFLDCRPDIDNVVFIGNIVNATPEGNQQRSIGYKWEQSDGLYAMSAPPWFYPPWRAIEGKQRIQDRTVIAKTPSGIFTHPDSAKWGWVINTINNLAVDKQPISAFRNVPDVKHADPNRPASVNLAVHRRICFGTDAERTAGHYTSPTALSAPLGHNTDTAPRQALVAWTDHNPACREAENCYRWVDRCYDSDDLFAQPIDCPSPIPAGTEHYPDKTMVNENFVRVMNDSQLADTEAAAAKALRRLTNAGYSSDTPRWPWLTNPQQKIFECETRWWYCLRTTAAGQGLDQFEWVKTRLLRIAFQYPLNKWGGAIVSTLDRETPTEQAIHVGVNTLVQSTTISAGR